MTITEMKTIKDATKTLPPGYELNATINLQTDRKLLILLNLVSVLLGLILTVAMIGFLFLIRPNAFNQMLAITENVNNQQMITYSFIMIGMMVLMLVLHEAVHGIFFWFFTRDRVKFAFKGAYAYAAAPGWYFSRTAYLPTCLAPLVVISVIGLLLLAFCPVSWILPILAIVITNGAGAVGDIYVANWLRGKPEHAYYQDEGDIFSMYLPQTDQETS